MLLPPEPARIDRGIDLPDGFGAGRVIGGQTPMGLSVTLYCPFSGIDEPEATWRVITTDARGFPQETILDGDE